MSIGLIFPPHITRSGKRENTAQPTLNSASQKRPKHSEQTAPCQRLIALKAQIFSLEHLPHPRGRQGSEARSNKLSRLTTQRPPALPVIDSFVFQRPPSPGTKRTRRLSLVCRKKPQALRTRTHTLQAKVRLPAKIRPRTNRTLEIGFGLGSLRSFVRNVSAIGGTIGISAKSRDDVDGC